MNNFSEYNSFNKKFFEYSKEHDKLIKKFNLNFIFLKSTKIPIICLYNIVDVLFKNNFKRFEKNDIILLTLVSIAILSKENVDNIEKLISELTNRKIVGYVSLVKKTIKSIKNISNIILKNDGLVITNIEQFLKYKNSIKILILIYSYISIFEIKIKIFSNYFLGEKQSKLSKDLLKYIHINYN